MFLIRISQEKGGGRILSSPKQFPYCFKYTKWIFHIYYNASIPSHTYRLRVHPLRHTDLILTYNLGINSCFVCLAAGRNSSHIQSRCLNCKLGILPLYWFLFHPVMCVYQYWYCNDDIFEANLFRPSVFR